MLPQRCYLNGGTITKAPLGIIIAESANEAPERQLARGANLVGRGGVHGSLVSFAIGLNSNSDQKFDFSKFLLNNSQVEAFQRFRAVEL